MTSGAQKSVASRVQAIMSAIDREGAPPLSKGEWPELLDEVCSECESRAEATRAELRHAK